MVRAAVLSAHGNSGAIVAEMIISLSRALERSGLIVPTEPERGLAQVLKTVAVAGRRAVARPVEGTILTVATRRRRRGRAGRVRRGRRPAGR